MPNAEVAQGTGAAHSPEAVAREPDPTYKHGRIGHPAVERRMGMSRSEDGIERLRQRIYDRLGDHYEETVLNLDGTVHHHTSEPLSKHRAK
jgi:hypothetical protein